MYKKKATGYKPFKFTSSLKNGAGFKRYIALDLSLGLTPEDALAAGYSKLLRGFVLCVEKQTDGSLYFSEYPCYEKKPKAISGQSIYEVLEDDKKMLSLKFVTSRDNM